ncbi:hypothetical protein BDV27DRAFT_152685 [Aspergillus caelatus]|uniref:Uncharacterized protein n=1 Tax=Aspergillus caelatus TaxID=61420 RepID=A0A5N7AJF9_9EURO|nr:uncharacterized protein BDV27DRAFT_152685 [Aspergillus caelatus]KAE8369803.1 hypothetical protein BDV27DRAFT_152685 [Aspergillus caelatus]
MELTVGQASGIINFGVAIVGITLPLGIAYVLSWQLPEENNAITWSVGTRVLQATIWPSIIGADTSASKRVSWLVFCLGWGITIGQVLVSITGIITPLGLRDRIKPAAATPVPFVYVPDKSPYGLGTPPRPDAPFSRSCGGSGWVVCPGSNGTDAYFLVNKTIHDIIPNNGTYSARMPYNLTQIFSSATSGTNNTVSGPFDIQYRQVFPRSMDQVDKGEPYIVGSYRVMENLILHDKIEAIEGLIVDSTRGGLGYRNHTVPANLPTGGRWAEDITWLEPLIECVNTNLSIRFTLNYTDYNGNRVESHNVRLKDRGGFSNLPLKGPRVNIEDMQANPDLRTRATQLAFFHNGMLMWALGLASPNISAPRNVTSDKEYPLVLNGSLTGDQHNAYRPDSIQIPGSDGLFINSDFNTSNSLWSFQDTALACRGLISQYTSEPLDNSTVGIDCGLIQTAPRRLDGADPRIYEAGSEWEQDIYMCTSAVQASIRTVEFALNGSSTLDDLIVSSVKDKVYDTHDAQPLWAIEITGQPASVTAPLWGPISEQYTASKNLITIKSERLLLPPAYPDSASVVNAKDSMAASYAPLAAQHVALGESFLGQITSRWTTDLPIADYTGKSNFALSRRWQQLSAGGEQGAATILKLIFTDILATATIGSQTPIGLSGSDTGRLGGTVPSGDKKVRIEPFQRKIEYNLPYAVPAFITLALWVVVLVAFLVALFVSRFSFSKLRQQLNLSSVGRLYTNLVHPDECQVDAKTETWIEQVGGLKFRLDRKDESNAEDPSAESHLMEEQNESSNIVRVD